MARGGLVTQQRDREQGSAQEQNDNSSVYCYRLKSNIHFISYLFLFHRNKNIFFATTPWNSVLALAKFHAGKRLEFLPMTTTSSHFRSVYNFLPQSRWFQPLWRALRTVGIPAWSPYTQWKSTRKKQNESNTVAAI